MTIKRTTNPSLRYWLLLLISLGLVLGSLACSGVVLSEIGWVDSIIHGLRVTITSFLVVLGIPRLLSLAITGRDVPALKL